MKKQINVVACALYNANKQVLLSKRPEGKHMSGLWEFPGGKIEAGETDKEALVREMYEELNLEINEVDLEELSSVIYEYDDFVLNMKLFVANKWSNEIIHHDKQVTAWVDVDKMADMPMPPADVPLVADIVKFFSL